MSMISPVLENSVIRAMNMSLHESMPSSALTMFDMEYRLLTILRRLACTRSSKEVNESGYLAANTLAVGFVTCR